MASRKGAAIRTDEMTDQKNMLLAIVLSAIVLIGWQVFFGLPQMEAQRQKQAQQQTQTAPQPGAVQQPGAVPQPGAPPQPGAVPQAPAGQPPLSSRPDRPPARS